MGPTLLIKTNTGLGLYIYIYIYIDRVYIGNDSSTSKGKMRRFIVWK